MSRLAIVVLLPLALLLGALSLASCDALDPAIGSGLHAAIARGVEDGTFTAVQGQRLDDAVTKLEEGSSVWSVLGGVLSGIGTAALGYLGINRSRGPAKPMDQTMAQILRQLAQERIDASATPSASKSAG